MPTTGTSLLVTAQRRREAGPAKSQAVMNIKARLNHQPREARNPGEGSTFEGGSLLTCKTLFIQSPKCHMCYVSGLSKPMSPIRLVTQSDVSYET
jgi:hypothetical protein